MKNGQRWILLRFYTNPGKVIGDRVRTDGIAQIAEHAQWVGFLQGLQLLDNIRVGCVTVLGPALKLRNQIPRRGRVHFAGGPSHNEQNEDELPKEISLHEWSY